MKKKKILFELEKAEPRCCSERFEKKISGRQEKIIFYFDFGRIIFWDMRAYFFIFLTKIGILCCLFA